MVRVAEWDSPTKIRRWTNDGTATSTSTGVAILRMVVGLTTYFPRREKPRENRSSPRASPSIALGGSTP